MEDSLVKNIKLSDATFADVLLPMAQDENEMGLEGPTLGFYQSVSTNKELRDASTEADQLFSNYGIESAMREDVFKLVDAVSKAEEKLDPESERYLEKARKGYIKYGLGIPAGPKRDRFKEIKQRLSDISIKFSKALNEENGGLWFTPEELAGVPEDLVSDFKKGENEHEGKLWVTFKYPVSFIALCLNNVANAKVCRICFQSLVMRRTREHAEGCLWRMRTNATKTCRSFGRQFCSVMRRLAY